MFVLYGERPVGGGSVVRVDFRSRRSERTWVGSRSEPNSLLEEYVTCTSSRTRSIKMNSLCVTCILEEVSVVLPFRVGLFGDGFSGEENMPSRFSMPFSSRAFSLSVIPVFLGAISFKKRLISRKLRTGLEPQHQSTDSLAVV